MSSVRRHASWLLALALVLTQSPLGAAAAEPREQVREITSTERGRDVAQGAAAYIEEKYGLAISPDELAVWSIGDNVIAGPRGSTLALRDFVAEDGTTQQYFEATEP